MNSVKIIPGLSDHDIVEGVVDTKPASTKKAPRKVHLYRKADWDSLKSYMKDFCNSFVLIYEGKSVETLWLELKAQFQSVFSIRSPLRLAKLCHSKLLNGTASLLNLLPENVNCKYPSVPDIDISASGIAKLLSNLNVSKAAGPDSLRPIVLKELSQVIAPAISIIFQISLDSGTVPSDWKKAQVCPLFKKQVARGTDPYP